MQSNLGGIQSYFVAPKQTKIYYFSIISLVLFLSYSHPLRSKNKLKLLIELDCSVFSNYTLLLIVCVSGFSEFFFKHSFNLKYYFRPSEICFYSKADTLGNPFSCTAPMVPRRNKPLLLSPCLFLWFIFFIWELLLPCSLHPTSHPQLVPHSDV